MTSIYHHLRAKAVSAENTIGYTVVFDCLKGPQYLALYASVTGANTRPVPDVATFRELKISCHSYLVSESMHCAGVSEFWLRVSYTTAFIFIVRAPRRVPGPSEMIS
jgi:hypothetical protein